jgi:flagellar hook-basal body complex protein FliE
MASRSILFAAIVVLALSACAQAKNPVFDEDMQEGWFFSPSEAEEAVAPTPPAPAADVVKHTESYKFILTEFSNILDIIQEETDFDNALVAAKQKLVEEAEAAEKAAEAAYNLAVKEFQDAKAAYEKAEAEYNQAVATYIKNKAVRDAERDLSSSI